jgi:hypothetical protein
MLDRSDNADNASGQISQSTSYDDVKLPSTALAEETHSVMDWQRLAISFRE